jgi:hypothetical protein
MDDKSVTQMTSSEFVSFANHVSRHSRSWDEATASFPGRPRWDGPVEADTSSTQTPTAEAGSTLNT